MLKIDLQEIAECGGMGGTFSSHKSNARMILEGIWEAKTPGGRIYRTYVPLGKTTHVFTTTHRDLHLKLGLLTDNLQRRLARLLLDASEHNSQLMLWVAEDKAILVTTTFDEEEVVDPGKVFTLAQAN